MRETKYRVWDKEEKTMRTLEQIYKIGGVKIWSDNLDTEENFILLEYTGIKDKNGEEICEGDIIQGELLVMRWNEAKHTEYEDEVVIKPIVVKRSEFGFLPFIYWLVKYLDILEMRIEVIGNIYENQKLLEVKP